MNIRAKVFFILMMLMLLLPSVAMVFGSGTSFTSENIELTSMPSFINENGINQNFFNEFDSYLSSHIGFRGQLVEANTTVFTKLFNMSPEDDVVYGTDGWLYYSKTLDDYFNINSVSDRGIRNIAYSLKLLEEGIRANDSEFVLCFAPNKNTLYPDNMPFNYRQSSNLGNLDRLEAALNLNGVNYVSLKDLFNADSEVYYRKKDSHWNYRGALKAYNAIMSYSNLEYDTYDGLEFADSYEWTGDLSNMLYATSTIFDSQLTPIRTFGYQYVSKQKNVEANRIDTYNREGNGKALIYRDSFGNTLIPFFADNFENCHFSKITPYNMSDVEENNPDVTIIELVERNIPNLAKTAPVMMAPVVSMEDNKGYLVTGSQPLYTAEYEEVNIGTHIYGTIQEDILGDSYKVYAFVEDSEGVTTSYEAFPIYEKLLIDGTDDGYPKDNGFSLYVPGTGCKIVKIVVATKGAYYIL